MKRFEWMFPIAILVISGSFVIFMCFVDRQKADNAAMVAEVEHKKWKDLSKRLSDQCLFEPGICETA